MRTEAFGILVAFLAIFLLLFGLATFIQFIGSLATYHTNKYFGPYLMLRKLKKPYHRAIRENMPFYEKLDKKNREKFEKRVQRFIDIKEFIPRGDLNEITPDMKALIAGYAIKLTFGYPAVYLTHFWRILLYNNNYYSDITKKYHKGEVNTKGHIVLSWVNFMDGHANRTDGINLGLHEMSHALRIENAILNQEYNFLDFNSLYIFTMLSKREMKQIKDGNPSLFRNYAATNEHEFFAVFVENFFERPELVREKHPKMYKAMSHILNQDLLSI
jgi:Mlc titration factor MtfA (ptsG expression regulator)